MREVRVWMVCSVLSLTACSSEHDLSSANAGHAQSAQRHEFTQSLATNGRVVVAGTQAGSVLVSADQGVTWRHEAAPGASMLGLATCPDGSFVGVDFYSRVWSAGADAAGWTSVKLERPHTPLAVACDANGTWWITGTGSLIAASRDHGATWTVTDQGEDVQYTTLQFVDKDFGVATGEFGNVLVTEDGGASWTKRVPIPGDFYPYATLFANHNDGWSSGLAGQVVQTHDGGRSWQTQPNETGAPLYRLFMHHGVPHGVGAIGTVARLDGDTWRAVTYPDAKPMSLGAGVSLDAANTLVIGGPAGLLRSVAVAAQ